MIAGEYFEESLGFGENTSPPFLVYLFELGALSDKRMRHNGKNRWRSDRPMTSFDSVHNAPQYCKFYGDTLSPRKVLGKGLLHQMACPASIYSSFLYLNIV